MPISLQSDAVLPQGHILVDGQRVASFSATGGLSASSVRAESIGGTAGQFLVPVGAVMAFTTSAAPSGWLKLNGAELIRSDFPALWTFAQSSGNIVSEATWTATTPGAFSTGNTTTTFRIPDLRGEFIRGWADGRAVDTGRVFGALQNQNTENHQHETSMGFDGTNFYGWQNASNIPIFGSRSFSGAARTRAGAVTEGNQPIRIAWTDGIILNSKSGETRPRNVALLYCIKY